MKRSQLRKPTSVLRILALMLALPPGVLVSISLVSGGFRTEMMWLHLALAMVTGLLGMLALFGHMATPRTIVLWALVGGALLGATGLFDGYFKPDLFGAEGNLAPLTGVFWTSPIGFICGVLLGLMVCWIRTQPRTFGESDRESIKPQLATPRNPKVKNEA